MMLSPCGRAVFIEVPKTGSTACVTHLRDKAGWYQAAFPGMARGRHAWLVQPVEPVTFGVLRNPWDRMVSVWKSYAPRGGTLKQWLNQGAFKLGGADLLSFTQIEWLAHVEFRLRYEMLAADWVWLRDILYNDVGVLLPDAPIPKMNVSPPRDDPEWTPELIAWVKDRFAADVDAGQYEGPSTGW